jgi:hypothetical protein
LHIHPFGILRGHCCRVLAEARGFGDRRRRHMWMPMGSQIKEVELKIIFHRILPWRISLPLRWERHCLTLFGFFILHRRTEADTKLGDVIGAFLRRHYYLPGSSGGHGSNARFLCEYCRCSHVGFGDLVLQNISRCFVVTFEAG